MKKASGFIMVLVLAAGFLACNTGGGPGASLPAGAAKGTVAVSLSIEGLGPLTNLSNVRTVFPDIANNYFEKYTLTFTPSSGSVPAPVDITEGTNKDVTLPVGTYTIAAAAIKESAEIAIGSLAGIVVAEGENTPATIVLGPKTGSGNGTFAYSIDLTEVTGLDNSKGSLTITPVGGGAATTIDLTQTTKIESTQTLAAGYYRVSVSLIKGSQGAGFSGEILHIYAGLTSTLPAKTFTDQDDFYTLTPVSASLDLGSLFDAPAAGEAPNTELDGVQYIGAIVWSPSISDNKFAATETYTAAITLTPVVGYTFTGVELNGIAYSGASSVGSGTLESNGTVTVSIVFPATGTINSSVNLGVAFYHDEIEVSGYTAPPSIPQSGSLALGVTGYAEVEWYLDHSNTALSEGLSNDGASLALSAANLGPGSHRVTVAGTKYDKPYSRVLEFTVTAASAIPQIAPENLVAYLATMSGGDTPDTPATVALTSFDLTTDTWGTTVKNALAGLTKYLVLDLSACNATGNENKIVGTSEPEENNFNILSLDTGTKEHIVGIILPDSITLMNMAFRYMTGIRSAVIPPKVASLGSYTFGGCSNLVSITIPATVTTVGVNAFNGSGVTTVIFEGTNTAISGTNSFPNALKTYYDQQESKAGTYIYNGSWTKQN
jgi:hypothetical protein